MLQFQNSGMDFIPADNSYIANLGLILIGLGALSLAVLCVLFLLRKVKRGILIYPLAPLGVGFFVLILSFVNFPTLTPSPQERAAARAIEETYGIGLDSDEIKGLNYPVEKPTASFKSFGSFEQMLPSDGDSFELNRVFLIWKDGQFFLAQSANGEEFTELEVQR